MIISNKRSSISSLSNIYSDANIFIVWLVQLLNELIQLSTWLILPYVLKCHNSTIMHLIYVPLFYKCYLCVIGRSIYCRKIHLTIFHKYYYVIADFLSLCSDLPGFPHFAGDSRISKTIVVSPSPHVINMYESPHIDNSLLVILFFSGSWCRFVRYRNIFIVCLLGDSQDPDPSLPMR